MTHRIRNLRAIIATGLLALATIANANPVENVIGVRVTSPGALITSMDELFESGAMEGYDLALWANAFDGTNPATHTIVASFDDYDAHDRLTERRMQHPGWARFGLAVRDISTVVSTGFVVEQMAAGEMDADHRAGAAVIMTVTDPTAYASAWKRMTEATGNPGSARLLQLRFGGQGATHAVVFSAPNSADLNEFLDELVTTDAFQAFAEEAAPIRTVRTINNYRLVKRWQD